MNAGAIGGRGRMGFGGPGVRPCPSNYLSVSGALGASGGAPVMLSVVVGTSSSSVKLADKLAEACDGNSAVSY